MTVVNTDSQILLWEYQYKENHTHTGTTNEYKPKDDYIYMDMSFDHLCKKGPKPCRNLRRWLNGHLHSR